MKMKKRSAEVHAPSEWNNPRNKPSMGATSQNHPQYPTKSKIEESGKEIKRNPPSILKSTARKFGKKAAKRQRVATMLAKARKGK